MSAVTVYCAPCRKNHGLTGVEAEVVIQTLIAEWASAATEAPDLEAGREGWEVADGFCVVDHLHWVQDGETYAEHIEQMRESRLYFSGGGR